MPYLEGPTLRAALNSGLLPVAPCTGNANGNNVDISDVLGIRKHIAGIP